jgi:PAS domain S-box-containing protein
VAPLRDDGGSDAGAPNQYRELFERSADAILIIDKGTFVDCNLATVKMLGYRTKSELLQTHPSELSPEFQPDGRSSFEKAEAMILQAFEAGSHRFEWDHRRSDGSVFPVEVLLTAVPRGDREILHVVWRDITDRKRLEAELRHAQKMEAIGRLTGGIAHDFNNLLVAINGYAELLQMELPVDSPFLEYVERIKLAGDRAAGLIRQLLAFSRKQVLKPVVIDLNTMLTEVEKLLGPMLDANIVFECRHHDGPLPVRADPGSLEQVVINLITNARDAIDGRGTMILRTGLETVTSGMAFRQRSLRPGAYAVLVLSDSGSGIPDEHLDKIFEPFFSTKEMHRGTGLGLATVHGIVNQSGGEIDVRSELGVGTTFTVYLPLAAQEPIAGEAAVRTLPAARIVPPRTILLVEDEPAVLDLVKDTLDRIGYTVFTAGNGREALDLIEDQGLVPDLLLTDVVMPEMGGPELARSLTARFPAMKVLFASGYPDHGLGPNGMLAAGVELIHKPFGPRLLVDRVRQILGSV